MKQVLCDIVMKSYF